MKTKTPNTLYILSAMARFNLFGKNKNKNFRLSNERHLATYQPLHKNTTGL